MDKTRNKEITREVLLQYLDYDESTGAFKWKKRELASFSRAQNGISWNGRYAGKPAFNYIGVGGYRSGKFQGIKLYAHRVAWMYLYGEWPLGDVDHINRNRSDNRKENLRLATRSENIRNSTMHFDSPVGYKGVRKHRSIPGLYEARIYINKKMVRIGKFNSAIEAREAYIAAAEKHFGEFACGGV